MKIEALRIYLIYCGRRAARSPVGAKVPPTGGEPFGADLMELRTARVLAEKRLGHVHASATTTDGMG